MTSLLLFRSKDGGSVLGPGGHTECGLKDGSGVAGIEVGQQVGDLASSF